MATENTTDNQILQEEKKAEVAETNGAEKAQDKNGDAVAESNDARESDKTAREDKDQGARDAETADRKDGGSDDDKHRPRQYQSQRGRPHPSQNYSRHAVKSKYEDLPESSDADEIRQQVHFYFSDENLLQDTFLRKKIGGPANNWVDIQMIASFQRMKRFKPYSAVIAALKESDVLAVNEKDQVRRKTPLPDTENFTKFYEDITLHKSVYAKGFGRERSNTQIEIENLFRPYGAESVRLRRDRDGTFKESAFIMFDSEESAKSFLESDVKPKWEDKELLIKSKDEYCKEKEQLISEGKIERNENHYDRRDNHRGKDYKKRGYDRRHRSRSPRRHNRDRSRSPRRGGRGNWKSDRDSFQKTDEFRDEYGRNKRDRRDRRDRKDRNENQTAAPAEIEKDADGVPIVKATEPEPQANKRAREDAAEEGSPDAKRNKA